MSRFNFLFKGKEYTHQDVAQNQGLCPHCGKNSIDYFWRPWDDAFIGVYKLSKHESIYCFECPKCFEKFFYHQSNDMVKEEMKLKNLGYERTTENPRRK